MDTTQLQSMLPLILLMGNGRGSNNTLLMLMLMSGGNLFSGTSSSTTNGMQTMLPLLLPSSAIGKVLSLSVGGVMGLLLNSMKGKSGSRRRYYAPRTRYVYVNRRRSYRRY